MTTPSSIPTPDHIEVDHRWQHFRLRCVELATAVHATPENVVEVATKIGDYILTKSPQELKISPKNKDVE